MFVAGFALGIFFIFLLICMGCRLKLFRIAILNNETKIPSSVNSGSVSIDVKEFVSTTIAQVIEGVTTVQKKFQSTNGATDALINPAWIPFGGPDESVTNHVRRISEIEFDLVVAASESTTSQGGVAASIKVPVFDGMLNSGVSSDCSQYSTNRIRFKIPVRFPLMKPAKADWNQSD